MNHDNRSGPRRKPRGSRSEHSLQASIVAALRRDGHTVMVCGTRARFGPRPFSPTTPGCPDLFALPNGLLNGNWLGLEVKRPHAKVSMGGRQLEQVVAGHVCLIRSIEEARQAIYLASKTPREIGD